MTHKIDSFTSTTISHSTSVKSQSSASSIKLKPSSKVKNSKALHGKKFTILTPDTSLKKLVPISTNFFEKVIDGFTVVVRWMLRRPEPLALKSLELALAMELYRSDDNVLLELTKNPEKIPEGGLQYSNLLGFWAKFLKKTSQKVDKQSSIDKKEISRISTHLSKSVSIQRAIERIDKLPEKKQVQAYNKLHKKTFESVKKLKEGERCYIPGAIRDDSGIHYLMYEIEKDKNGYSFHAFGVLEDKTSPLEAIDHFDNDDALKNGIRNMLASAIDWKGERGDERLQNIMNELMALGSFSGILQALRKSPLKVFKLFNQLIGVNSALKFLFSKKYRENFDFEKHLRQKSVLFHEANEFTSHLNAANIRQQKSPSTKTVEVFLKGIQTEMGSSLKLTLRASLLENIFHKSKKQLHMYPDLRKELQHEMEKLYETIDKQQDDLELSQQKKVLTDLIDALKAIDAKDRVLPKAPSKQRGVKSAFNGLMCIPQTPTPIETFKTMPPLQIVATKEIFPELSFNTPSEISNSLEEALNYCQNLIANKDYLNLDAALVEIIDQIQDVDLTTLDDDQIEKAKEAISTFTMAFVHCHFALKREGISAGHYQQLATLARLYDRDFFESPTSKDKNFFAHPYMELGLLGTEEFKTSCNLVFNALDKVDFADYKEFKKRSILHWDPNWLEDHSELDLEERGVQCMAMCIAAMVAGDTNPKKNGPVIKDPEIASRIAEAIVTDDGVAPKAFAIPKVGKNGFSIVDMPYSSSKTAHAILEEKYCFSGLPMDVSAELQLMQTEPNSFTRVKYAMGAFSKYPGIFGNAKIGLDWQRVFSITLTQNATLDKLLQSEPEYALVYLDVLRGMIEDVQASGNIGAAIYLMRIQRETLPILESLQTKIEDGDIIVSDQLQVLVASKMEEIYTQIGRDFDQIAVWREKAESEALNVAKAGKVTNVLRNRSLIHQQYLYHVGLNSQLANDHPLYKELDDETIEDIFVSDFILKQTSVPANSVSLDVERVVNRLTWKASFEMNDIFKKSDVDQLQDLLELLLPPEAQGKKFTEANHPLYYADEYTIDVEKKILYIHGKAKRLVPASIAGDANCSKVFGETGLFALRSTYKNIKYNENGIEKYGEKYTFKFNGQSYAIVANDNEDVLIYRKCILPGQKKPVWFLFQDIDFLSSDDWHPKAHGLPKDTPKPPRQYIPDEIRETQSWVHPQSRFVFADSGADKKGHYIALSRSLPKSWRKRELNGANIVKGTKIYEATPKKETAVLNPWHLANFKIFQTLDTHDHIVATGKNGSVTDLAYSRLNLSYRWNNRAKAWDAVQFPGYTLTGKKVNNFLEVAGKKKGVGLFTSDFNDYQIVEHSKKLPKLLLNGCEYHRGTDNNLYKKFPDFTDKTTMLYSYDIDPQVGLKCQNASGYFYLAYVLYTQKRYTEALAYLKKAHSLDIHKAADFEKIAGWIRNWEDDSNEGVAFKLHFEHQMFEFMRLHNPKGFATAASQKNLAEVDAALNQYKKIKDNISSSLHLSRNQEVALALAAEFDLLKAQKNAVKFVQDHPEFHGIMDLIKNQGVDQAIALKPDDVEELRKALKAKGILLEELHALAEADLLEKKGSKDQRLRNLAALERSKGFRLLYVLQSDIRFMQRHISKKQSHKKPRLKVAAVKSPIFPNKFLNTIIENAPAKVGDAKQKLRNFKNAFMQDNDNEYLKEKGREYTNDTKVAVNNLSNIRKLKKDVDIHNLQQKLQKGDKALGLEGYEPLREEASAHKAEVLKLLHVKTVKPGSDWEAVKVKLEQREETLTQAFNRARFCYAANDFRELVRDKIVKEQDIPALKKSMRAFLEKDTKRQQYFRALEKAKLIAEGGDIDILGPQLIQILDQQRAYDLKKDRDTPILLVFEWECGYIATFDQIKNFKDVLSEANLFKLEALAGGKTTVIRNIIAKFKADGYHLSGVVTHIPLAEMHHPLFEKAAREAYGEKVLTFSFSRASPTDVVSLTQILYNLNQMIVEKGRVDLSKKDLLSLHHAVLLKWDNLQKAAIYTGLKPDPSKVQEDLTVQKELDVANEILLLLERHLTLGSDEMDTIANCEEEHIFAYGGKMPLNPQKVKSALKIMKWILTEPDLDKEKQAFQSNKQSKFTNDEREEFLEKLAGLVYRDIAPDLDKDQLISYLLDPLEAGETTDFYTDQICAHTASQDLKAFKKYFQDIITESTLRKQGGVKFGRSEDGWLVKPYEFSDKCMENSQECTEEETIWFTVCNYIDGTLGGVKADQIGELVQTSQAEAAKEVKSARQLDKIVTFADTKAAKAWDADFDIPLLEVVPEQYGEIADQINKDPKLLRRFLLNYVFPKNYSSREKVGANAHDLAEMVLEFYGSAGTSELAPTFPEKIVLKEELVKQEGVNGRVLWSLIKTFQDGDIFYSDDVLETLGEEMKEGDALIDLSPAFPGISGMSIAQQVGSKLEEKGKISPDGVIRFLDRANEPRILDLATGNDIAMPGNLNTKKTTNILTQKDSRGTNFEMADESVGYLTIGPSTSLTDFMQAALRMRKLPERLLSDSPKGQRLRYILDPAVKGRLGDNPTMEDLLAFLGANEVEQLKRLRFKSEKQKIEALPRTSIFKALHAVKDYEARRIIWPVVKEYFFQKSQASVDEGGIPNQTLPSLEILILLAGKKKEQIQNIIALIEAVKSGEDSGLSKETEADIDEFLVVLEEIEEKLQEKEDGKNLPKAEYLPKEMSTTVAELDMHQTAEQEQELEAEQQLQLQQIAVAIAGQPVSNPRPRLDLMYQTPQSLCNSLYAIDPTAQLMNLNGLYQSLKKSVPYMDEYTYYTRGAYPNFMNNQDAWSQYDPAKAGQIQIPRVLVMVDRRHAPPRVVSVVGTQNDFIEIDAFVKTHKDNPQIDLYVVNIRNDKLDGGLYEWNEDYSEDVKKAISQRLIQMKFLNGEIDLLKPKKDEASPIRQEYTAFKRWLTQMIDDGIANAEELEKVYLQYLQAYRPSQVPQYHTSAVAAVFLKLKARGAAPTAGASAG